METLPNDLKEQKLKSQQEHKLEHDKFHIQPDSKHLDDHTHVLNHSNSFAIIDRWGDIYPDGRASHGIYHRGTRFINQWMLTIDRQRPLLLGSTIKENNNILSIDLTNPVLQQGKIPENTIHIFRHQLIRENGLFERITCINYNESDCQFELELYFDGDFKDIFEIRGTPRKLSSGHIRKQTLKDQHLITITYVGQDHIERKVCIQLESPQEVRCRHGKMSVVLHLKPGQEVLLRFSLLFEINKKAAPKIDFEWAKKHILQDRIHHDLTQAQVTSSNIQLNLWLNRAYTDLFSLNAHIGSYTYPFAGVPWYNTPFGRDGLITTMELLWINPLLAKNVLEFLAFAQAHEVDPLQDAEPGKILHEAREGEMANTGEIPFKKYYGTVDATPLFIMLAGMYYERTADLHFIKSIWPAIQDALKWIDQYGDIDGDGLIEYQFKNPKALTNQGWKDSKDAIMHQDGTLAKGSIALCEVQGYAYKGKLLVAKIAEDLQLHQLAIELLQQAKRLKETFNVTFWDTDLNSYILALDGQKMPCRVMASNAGHALFTGIADPLKAAATAARLMEKDMYSGWGIRTLSVDAVKFNPMSYHNGSVWPHDNALIAMGFAQYGFKEEALRIFDGFFEATTWIDLNRLPELFCGLKKRNCEGPIAYPVACSPQAWSVGAVFLLLQSVLGLEINALQKRIIFHDPQLPKYVNELSIRNLKIDGSECAIDIQSARPNPSIKIDQLPQDWSFRIDNPEIASR